MPSNFLSNQVDLFKLISEKVAFCALSVSEEINHFILAVCGDDNPFDGSFRKDLTSTPFLCLLLEVDPPNLPPPIFVLTLSF